MCTQLLSRFVADANFVMAPNLWLPNISDFCPVYYRIWAVLQE